MSAKLSRICALRSPHALGNLSVLGSRSISSSLRPLQIQSQILGRRLASSMAAMPLNLPKWLEQNSHLLQPPVNNYCVYHPSSPATSGLTVMVVGGPNARTDYHINCTPEFFFQYRGSMLLKIMDTSTIPHTPVDIPIHENSLYLLPANTPHSPVRFADTVGVVLEQPRPVESIDTLRWYCEQCRDVVHEKRFHCTDLGTQIKEAVLAFESDGDARRCKNCGTVASSRPAPGEIEQPSRFSPE